MGDVSVNALPYGLGNETGYETVVAFTAVNPSDFPMVSPYRVTVTGGGKTLDTTSGSDNVVLAPHQQLLVVSRPNNVRNTPPDKATVSFYSNEAGQIALPDPSGWKLTDVTAPNCDSGIVGCEVNADLVYDGATNVDMQLKFSSVAITFTENGKTVLAGSLSRNSSSNGLLPGKPVPVTGYVIGKTPRLDNLEHQYGVQVIAPTY